jgi:hypothetical protein
MTLYVVPVRVYCDRDANVDLLMLVVEAYYYWAYLEIEIEIIEIVYTMYRMRRFTPSTV